MAELNVGAQAPEFSLTAQDEKTYSLKKFRGKKVVVYFYSEDDSGTCTDQACSFRDHMSRIGETGAVVLGISPDGLASHKKFSSKYSLNFLILSDEDKSVMKKYGVWKRKKLFGNVYMGVIRTTFVINESGTISHIFSKVRIKGHVNKVIKALSE
ncbi:MAG: thioredoxin-dependent thiol peroxidase [Ignavibacteriales bacterium]|nr:thioredoxin-dependent thiol peroxidase [Ignavibacteriales bacterium]